MKLSEFKTTNPALFHQDAPNDEGNYHLILDTIREDRGEESLFFVYFSPFANFRNKEAFNKLKFYCDGKETNKETNFELIPYCGGWRAVIQAPLGTKKLEIEFAGEAHDSEKHELTYNPPELEKFEGLNTALLVLCDDTLDNFMQWVEYYVEYHDLEAVLVFNRQHPSHYDKKFSNKIKNFLSKHDKIKASLYIETDAPLGKLEPAERLPYSAPDLPGRDKMEVPESDPWRSIMAGSITLEILRQRYLANARAVLNLQIYDIIPKRTAKNIFDATVESREGYVQLYGRRVFPWRVRQQDAATFGDHICRRFDNQDFHRAWCIVPNGDLKEYVWKLYRVGKDTSNLFPEFEFWRCIALKHVDPKRPNIKLAPKASLIRDDELGEYLAKHFDANPVEPPQAEEENVKPQQAVESGRRLIVTTMKNEGPFILEWIAYHKAIGFDDFIVYSNDCTDGTDTMLDLLDKKGIIEHRFNPYKKEKLRPQHAALFDAPKSKHFKKADWIICMDCDEYVNIHVGDGMLDDLFAAVNDANMISMNWRLFGNADIVEFEDRPIIEQFNMAAPEFCRAPHQAWGIKTLYRNQGYYRKMGVHRPKGLKPEYRHAIKWVNGSGIEFPESFKRNAWRTGTATYGYGLVTLNHYAVRSMKSFLVKRDRGRVNHVDRDQGAEYWFRMNHNIEENRSIHNHIPKMRKVLDDMMADPKIKAQHEACVEAHETRIGELMASDAYRAFFDLINSERMRNLARFTNCFGNNVFLNGPHVVTDKALDALMSKAINYFNVQVDGTNYADLHIPDTRKAKT